MHCNFICGLSDVIIKTSSQSVSFTFRSFNGFGIIVLLSFSPEHQEACNCIGATAVALLQLRVSGVSFNTTFATVARCNHTRIGLFSLYVSHVQYRNNTALPIHQVQPSPDVQPYSFIKTCRRCSSIIRQNL